MLLIQYMDDLFLASHKRTAYIQPSLALLLYLGKICFLIEKAKLQLFRFQVMFLRNFLSSRGIQLSTAQRQDILAHKKQSL